MALRPNTVLLEGSVLVLKLTGFSCEVEMGLPLNNILDADQQVSNAVTTRVYLSRGKAQCRLPADAKANHVQMTIGVTEAAVIYAEAVKTSRQILLRTFSASSLAYAPRQPLRTHQLTLEFIASVPLTPAPPVLVTMTDFQNIDTAKTSVHLTGLSAAWDVSLRQMRLPPTAEIAVNAVISVKIEENEGFLLPASLYANYPRLTIASVDNVPKEAVKQSDLVGDGPYAAQMYLYEVGIRRHL